MVPGIQSRDQDRPILLQGRVVSVMWRNPHAELVLELPPGHSEGEKRRADTAPPTCSWAARPTGCAPACPDQQSQSARAATARAVISSTLPMPSILRTLGASCGSAFAQLL